MKTMLMKVIFFLFIFASSVYSSVVINNAKNQVENFNIEYFYDEKSKFKIDDIEKINFDETIPSQFTKGYRYGNAWFKIVVKNESDNNDFVLTFSESIWSTLDLYFKEKQDWKVVKNGLNISLEDREIKDSTPAFNFKVDKNETVVLYIKGQTIASQLGEFKIYTKDEYFNPNRITLSEWYIIYAFVLFGFTLLNIYNFLMTRESIYGFYILYVFVYIVFISMHSGIYINFGFPNWPEGLHTLGQLTLLSLLLFSSEFLELKKSYPKMEKIFFYLSVGAFIFAILLSQDVPYSTIASNVYFSGVLITIIYVAISVLKRGFSGAKYYLIALMLYLPSMTLMAMNFNTILPNTDITRYSFLGGAFLEIFLFTLILTNRYKYIRKLNEELNTKTNELENAKDRLKQESITDFLTGTYNRRHFNELLSNTINSAKRKNALFSFLILDIDYFKQYNDRYGHHEGDKALIKVSSQIKKSFNRVGNFCFRLGGEEFGIIFKADDQEQALEFANKLRKDIESLHIEHLSSSVSKYVTISIGLVSKYANNVKNDNEVYKEADYLLYKAKKAGRNNVKVN